MTEFLSTLGVMLFVVALTFGTIWVVRQPQPQPQPAQTVTQASAVPAVCLTALRTADMYVGNEQTAMLAWWRLNHHEPGRAFALTGRVAAVVPVAVYRRQVAQCRGEG